MRRKGSRGLSGLAAVAALAVGVSAAGGPAAASVEPVLTGPQIVSVLNAERAANGLGPVRENIEWSRACALHLNWWGQNGNFPTSGSPHEETPGDVGYSEQGAWAGMRSVLAGGGFEPWRFHDYSMLGDVIKPTPARGTLINAWVTAPAHLLWLMNPKLVEVGAADTAFSACVVVADGIAQPDDAAYATIPAVSWYAGPYGPTAVPYAIGVGTESGYTFGSDPGIWNPECGRRPEVTGPYVFLYSKDDTPATDGRLTGPNGPLPVCTVSSDMGTMLVPVSPLTPSTDYLLEATLSGQPQQLAFRTAAGKTVTAKAKAVSRKSKVRVDVNPNKGAGYWTFQIQRKQTDGIWTTLAKTYKTAGPKETRTVNLPKGTYRIVVNAKYGYPSTTTAEVTLTK